jgi:hypothetical protein
MNPHFRIMPVDKTTIKTNLRIHYDINDCSPNQLIYKAYQPQDLPFHPITSIPGYLRIEAIRTFNIKHS